MSGPRQIVGGNQSRFSIGTSKIVFPRQFLDGFLYEKPAVELPSDEYGEMIIHLFNAEQLFDFISALEYIEHELQAIEDISQLTSAKLEKIIQELHRRVMHNVTLLNNQARLSGGYITTRTFMKRQPDNAELRFEIDSKAIYAEKNYQTLLTLYGEDAAKKYADFCHELNKFYHQKIAAIIPEGKVIISHERCYEIEKIDIIDIINDNDMLVRHPGFDFFLKTVAFSSSPADIARELDDLCKQVVQDIQEHVDPIKIAVKALLKMLKIRPFVNGNERTALLLANYILMQFGIMPINFDKVYMDFYEKTKGKDPVLDLIAFFQQHIPVPVEGQPITSNRHPVFQPQDASCLYIKREHCIDKISQQNLELYTYAAQLLDIMSENNFRIMVETLSKVSHPAINKVLPIMQNKPLQKETKDYWEKIRDDIVIKKINARWFYEAAKKWEKQSFSSASIYCWVRAAEYYKLENKFKKAGVCYAKAGLLCFKQQWYTSSYQYFELASPYLSDSDQQKIREFVDQLYFLKNTYSQNFGQAVNQSGYDIANRLHQCGNSLFNSNAKLAKEGQREQSEQKSKQIASALKM